MRINRFLAWAGLASRRKADELVRAGRVRINGHIQRSVGFTVDPDIDQVMVDGRPVKPPPEELVIILHKPAGYLVSRRSQGGKPTIYSILPPEVSHLHPVGRLDFDTDGVQLLTNDGELSRRLEHPRYRIERVYRAVVRDAPKPEKIKLAQAGVDLGDKTRARAEIRIHKRQARQMTVEVIIREGRKHEVKRLLAWAGAPVRQLTRVSFAQIKIGRLAPGAYRKLRREEIAALRRLTGLAEAEDDSRRAKNR